MSVAEALPADAEIADLAPPANEHPLPLFVLGLQRSGTTWLANMFAAHPQVAAVAAEEHHGIHESVFFSHFAKKFGDLGDEANFDRFATSFCSSDYFLITDLSELWFRGERPRTYAAAFRLVMDAYAVKCGATAWIEKSPHHTLLAPELATLFPDAKFICITRDTMDLMRSRLWSSGKEPPPYPDRIAVILRACAANAFYTRFIRGFVATHQGQAVRVTYEELRARTDDTLCLLCGETGVVFDRAMLSPRYEANSSFRSDDERKRGLNPVDRIVALLAMAAIMLVPQPFLGHLRLRFIKSESRDFPPWTHLRMRGDQEIPRPVPALKLTTS